MVAVIPLLFFGVLGGAGRSRRRVISTHAQQPTTDQHVFLLFFWVDWHLAHQNNYTHAHQKHNSWSSSWWASCATPSAHHTHTHTHTFYYPYFCWHRSVGPTESTIYSHPLPSPPPPPPPPTHTTRNTAGPRSCWPHALTPRHGGGRRRGVGGDGAGGEGRAGGLSVQAGKSMYKHIICYTNNDVACVALGGVLRGDGAGGEGGAGGLSVQAVCTIY